MLKIKQSSFFRNKKVLITGAASGIGHTVAVMLGRSGCQLFLIDINEAGLQETVNKIVRQFGGNVCIARSLNVADYSAMKNFAADIHGQYGVLDILINVAGVALFSQIEDMKHHDWERVININLWGVIHGIECFVPEMIKNGKGGHIVNVSSTAGIIGLPWHAAYAASKHALVGLSEVLRYDLRKHGIGVSVICPGAVNTGLVRTCEIHAQNKKATEKGRILFAKMAMTPEKVAKIILKAIYRKNFWLLHPWI